MYLIACALFGIQLSLQNRVTEYGGRKKSPNPCFAACNIEKVFLQHGYFPHHRWRLGGPAGLHLLQGNKKALQLSTGTTAVYKLLADCKLEIHYY